jgi:replicative DNA helicase
MTLTSLENYGISFQTKVISALLTDKPFLQNVNDILTEEYFSNSAHKWIVNEVLKYYQKYHTNLTMDVLKVEMKKVENEVLQISIKEQLKEAYRSSDESDLSYVEEEFTNFCKNQQLKKALLNSVDLLQAGDYDSIRLLVDSALRSGQNRDIGTEYEKDIETRYREDTRSPIAFPWKTFNGITQGGYGKGDLVLIFGNPKGGKSWAIVAMAAEAAKQGCNVVYYALELGEAYVGKRFDAYFTGIPVDQIDKHRDKVEEALSAIPGKIIIKGYPPKRASLTTIETHLDQLQNQNDFKVDAVFIDYLDLLKNRNKSRLERKDDTDDIFTDAKGLAKERDIPIISPSQANRSGAEKEILESSHIAGSFDKLMIGDIVISLARGRVDRLNGTGRWHFMGNRYGLDGVTYSSTIDTSTGHIEIEEEEFDVQSGPENKPKTNGGIIDDNERNFLKKKFFELEKQ